MVIDDPVHLKSAEIFRQLLRANIGGKVFTISRNKEILSLLLSEVLILDSTQLLYCTSHAIWVIGKGISRIGYSTVDKDVLFQFIKDDYPKHYEWLLFHPEWL